MGNSDSALQGSSLGFHVIEISGPAAQAGLEPFFDFITHINGSRIKRDLPDLKALAGTAVNIIVYSSKTCILRNLQVVPNEKGVGIKGRVCDFSQTHERVWHILEVQKNSPAEEAGLMANTDYILGTTNGDLSVQADFYNLIRANRENPIELIVYNSVQDKMRQVVIVPTNWDGDGLLGCDIGYGIMHRIALAFQKPISEDSKNDQNEKHKHNSPSKPSGSHKHEHEHNHSDQCEAHKHNGNCDSDHQHSDHAHKHKDKGDFNRHNLEPFPKSPNEIAGSIHNQIDQLHEHKEKKRAEDRTTSHTDSHHSHENSSVDSNEPLISKHDNLDGTTERLGKNNVRESESLNGISFSIPKHK